MYNVYYVYSICLYKTRGSPPRGFACPLGIAGEKKFLNIFFSFYIVFISFPENNFSQPSFEVYCVYVSQKLMILGFFYQNGLWLDFSYLTNLLISPVNPLRPDPWTRCSWVVWYETPKVQGVMGLTVRRWLRRWGSRA